MFSGSLRLKQIAALVATSVGFAGPLSAQALVDLELSSQIDFRSESFGICLDKSECTVGPVTIRSERRTLDGLSWEPAVLYWDPVDGLGVKDGAQNDEIDFNERIFVLFDEPSTVKKIWLSDLFRDEDGRYGSKDTDRIEGVDEDAEAAAITLYLDDEPQATALVAADDRLPWASFNQEVTWRFREDGDMRRRVVVDGANVQIIAPGENAGGRVSVEQFALGEIDPEKKSIFDGVETVEIDLTDILAEFNETDLFIVGTENFDFIQSLTEDPEALVRMRKTAEAKRESIDMSNGEVGWTFEEPPLVNKLEFVAPFDSSNDFSISGIIVAENDP